MQKDEEALDPLAFALVEVLDPDGADVKRGQTVEWLPEEERYLVHTFDGEQISVPREGLREFHPQPPEEEAGGFDAAFPASQTRSDNFTLEIFAALSSKHYCVVQMSSRPSDRIAAVNEAEDGASWTRLNADFEMDCLGRSPSGKKLQWVSDETPADGMENGIEIAVGTLKSMTEAVVAVTQGLGFVGSETSNILMTMKASEDEESALLAALEEDSDKVVDSRDIRDLLAFLGRRKICMMYCVSGSGGTLTFHPNGPNGMDIEIPCMENTMIIFQHDLLDYTFKPYAKQLVLQSWLLRDRFESEMGALAEVVPDEIITICDKIPSGPIYAGCAETTDITAMAMVTNGEVWNCEHYWNMFCGGCDGSVKFPASRWDHDIYWEQDAPPGGKAYCRHGGMLVDAQAVWFDHLFFGFTEVEAHVLDPGVRNVLSTGYEALFRGGWTKKELKGAQMPHVVGMLESEFSQAYVLNGLMGVSETHRTVSMMCSVASRLHYTFGTAGPASTVDTACSAGLYAVCCAHALMRPNAPDALNACTRKQYMYGLGMAANGLYHPQAIVALCGASMMTHMGRCFTYDQSGDGYLRAEGHGAMYLKQSSQEDFSKLNTLCGSNMNQDGRSASMTAPHGPSQQECIRGSLKEGNISAADIQIQEMHGTGTALGDPIEVGALRATMMTVKGVVRERGLVKTSAKSNIGHTEHCAGLKGIAKCVLLGISAVAAPNCHLRSLNPHIDSNGYPVYFTTELCDQGHACGYNGVSSFGFGGSNARGDVWARCINGPRNTNPPQFGFDLQRSRIEKFSSVFGTLEHATQDVKALAKEGGLMEYDGEFLMGDPRSSESDFYLEGSFNGWRKGQKMEFDEEKETYSTSITLGDTRVEHFRINVNNYDDAKIFPTARSSLRSQSRVLGPGAAPPGLYWVIDGHEDGAAQGTVYNITFWYDAKARQKKVHWAPTTDESALRTAAMKIHSHRYSICGSWAIFAPQKMHGVVGNEPGLFEVTFRIGENGHEEFHFLRDGNADEIIYPAHHRDFSGDSPVRGPDTRGKEKYFGIVGETGDEVMIQLQVWDGEITVTTESSSRGMITFRSISGMAGKAYFVVGEWNKWLATPLHLVRDDVWEMKFVLPRCECAQFQIIEDEDLRQAIHPEMPLAGLGTSCALGPDADGAGLYWIIDAIPGQSVVITLDMTQKDRRSLVSWSIAEGES